MEKDAQLSNIDVVILVPDDKFKTLKPNDTTSYENCVLVNKDNMSKISEQINEYEAETQSELAKQKYICVVLLYTAWLGILLYGIVALFATSFAKLSVFVRTLIRSLQLQLNQTKSACSKMNRTIAQQRSEVNDKMVKKFGMKIDFDEMEEAVLTRLLMNQPKFDDESARTREKELRKLKVIFKL